LIYVFEVGYQRNGYNLPPCIKDVLADNANNAKKKLKEEIPVGMKIRAINLIGSRQK
jgi:hypothetical protein